MSTAAAIGPAALGATSVASHGPVGEISGVDGAFNKVLSDQTAKALEERSLEGREGTAKPTKRHRSTNAVTPSALLAPLEVVELVGARDSAIPLDQRRHVLAAEPSESTKVRADSTDELTDARASLVRNDPSATSDDASVSPSQLVGATETELSTTPATLTRRSGGLSEDEDVAKAVEPSTEANVATGVAPETDVIARSVNISAPLLSSTAFSTSHASAPGASGSSPSRSGAPRTEPGSSSSTDAAIRQGLSLNEATSKVGSGSVIAPAISPTPRALVTSAPTTSTDNTGASSLDVADLASSISRAALGTDGSYTINVAMHPTDLGHVQAVVSLNGLDLHVAITPQTPTGHAALASAVDSLKGELSRSGLNVNVSLRDPESRSGRGNDDAPGMAPIDVDASDAEASVNPVNESLNVSQIHLIL